MHSEKKPQIIIPGEGESSSREESSPSEGKKILVEERYGVRSEAEQEEFQRIRKETRETIEKRETLGQLEVDINRLEDELAKLKKELGSISQVIREVDERAKKIKQKILEVETELREKKRKYEAIVKEREKYEAVKKEPEKKEREKKHFTLSVEKLRERIETLERKGDKQELERLKTAIRQHNDEARKRAQVEKKPIFFYRLQPRKGETEEDRLAFNERQFEEFQKYKEKQGVTDLDKIKEAWDKMWQRAVEDVEKRIKAPVAEEKPVETAGLKEEPKTKEPEGKPEQARLAPRDIERIRGKRFIEAEELKQFLKESFGMVGGGVKDIFLGVKDIFRGVGKVFMSGFKMIGGFLYPIFKEDIKLFKEDIKSLIKKKK